MIKRIYSDMCVIIMRKVYKLPCPAPEPLEYIDARANGIL